MPSTAKIEQIRFTLGVNEEDFLGDLKSNEVAVAINAILTKSGAIKKREGSSEYGTDAGTSAVYALKGFTDEAGNYWKLKAVSTTVKEYTGGAWSTSVKTGLTAGKFLQLSDFSAASATNTDSGTATAGGDYTLTDSGKSWTPNGYRDYIVKITSGTGAGQAKVILENTATVLNVDGRWDVNPDNTSVYTINARIKALIGNNGTDTAFKIYHDGAGGLTTTTLSSTFPKFSVQLVVNNRLWGITGSKVFWTDLSNGEYIPLLNFIDTGETLVSIGQAGENVSVYSKTKTGVILGNGPDSFSLSWRDRTRGCIAPHSVAHWKGMSIALAQDGVYAFDGVENKLVSRRIRPSISAIKSSDIVNSTGFVFENKYYLMHSKNSSSVAKDRIWVMDLIWSFTDKDLGVWTAFDGLSPNVMGTFQNSDGLLDLYIGESDTSRVVQLYDGTYNDLGANINFQVDTREYDLRSIGSDKKLHWFYYEGQTQVVDSDLQVLKNLNGFGFESFGTILHKQTGGLWDTAMWDVAVWGGSERVIKRLRPGGRGRTIQYQFLNNAADQPIEIYKFEQKVAVHNYH